MFQIRGFCFVSNYYLIKVDNADKCIEINDRLKSSGIDSSIVTAPSCLESGCGLSVRVRDLANYTARAVLENEELSKHLVIYRVDISVNSKYTYTRIDNM